MMSGAPWISPAHSSMVQLCGTSDSLEEVPGSNPRHPQFKGSDLSADKHWQVKSLAVIALDTWKTIVRGGQQHPVCGLLLAIPCCQGHRLSTMEFAH
ncbi:uncharacterized protein LOC143827697 isoform X2 [Paroedura picta]|uniref:uncharacterized protein LOC143827697 isoform X2 n=1 Tax=Paroedura picta TaxID=143630 RepID=UPI004057423E